MKLLSILLITSILMVAAFAQESVQMLRLKHRQAEELIPVIEGLFPGQVHVKTMNGRLFVRSSPAHFIEVKKLVDELDRKPKMLRISVASSAEAIANARRVGVGGGVGSNGRVRARGELADTDSQTQTKADRVLQTLEGSAAWIATGQPFASSGFYALAQLQGDGLVQLKVSQQEAALVAGAPVANVQSATTTVTGRLGQWIEVGGVDQSAAGKTSAILSRQSGASQGRSRVLIKVEESR